MKMSNIEKFCPTCKESFIVSGYLQKRVYCSKKCSNNDPAIKEKIRSSQKKTFDEKYGMHPMKTEKTKEKLKQSIQEKYGVEWISKSDGWGSKMKNTKETLYGSKTYNNRSKSKETCLEKYGVDNPRNIDDYSDKYEKTCLEKYGVPHASMGKKFKLEHNKSMFEKFLLHPKFINFTPMFTVNDYIGIAAKDYIFKCNRCNNIKSFHIGNGKYPICLLCDKNNLSTFQNEIYMFIKSILPEDIDVKVNDRHILYPKELDILIPAKKIAIECNGILWHSEVFGHKNKIYHLQKTTNCSNQGLKLLHIYDNEWRTKQHIVKSIISTNLLKPANILYARKCYVKEIPSRLCVDFLNENHMQKTDHSSIKIGLFDDTDNLLSVMTFLKSRFDKKIQWEMGRFCTKLGYSILGGASKLFSYFLKSYIPSSIVTYNDKRYFNGEVYAMLGFKYQGSTLPNYHYIVDNYQTIENRICWQKHKLKNKLNVFDPNLSEWENMKINGYDRIWDCGNGKWVWHIH
jgi:hypothetical protein